MEFRSLLLGLIMMNPITTQPLKRGRNHALPTIDSGVDQAHRKMVVNGRDSEPKPWFARIGYINARYKFVDKCGGALVNLTSFYSLEEQSNSSDFILTAKHCLLGKNFSLTHVWLNHSDTNDGIIMPIKKAFASTNNMSNLEGPRFDIGVVQTKGKSNLTSLELAELGYPPTKENNKVMVLGWGKLMPTKRIYPFTLQVGRMTTAPIGNCLYLLKKDNGFIHQVSDLNFFYGENTLCVIANLIAGDSSSLHGDSGGPIIMHNDGKDVIVGVVSMGFFIDKPVFSNGTKQQNTLVTFYTQPNTQEGHKIIKKAIKYFLNNE